MSREFEELESRLRQALRLESAPPDFVAGVLARIASEKVFRKVIQISWWRRKSSGLAIAATLLLAAIVPVSVMEFQKQRAEDAHRKLVEALRITRTRLEFTKRKMVRKGSL